MSLVPLAVVFVFLLPLIIAHAVRLFLPAATARLVGHVFDAVSWIAWAGCSGLGVYCLHAMSQNPTPWGQLGIFGLVSYVMLGSTIWAAFRLGYRALVPANRFTRFGGLPVHIEGWPAA